MPLSIPGARGIALLALTLPTLVAASEGSEFIFQFEQQAGVAGETARQLLEGRATRLFEQDISYPWPQAGDAIVLSLPRQQPAFTVVSETAIRARLRGGIVALVGIKSAPPLPASAWSQPAEGGVRVHGFIDLDLFSAALEQHLKGSRVNIPQGASNVQSLKLRTNGSQLEVTLHLAEQDEAPGVLVIGGTPRFVNEKGSASLVIPDAKVTYNGKDFPLLQRMLRTQRLWQLDVDLASLASKTEEFFEAHTRPVGRADVKPHPDVTIEVADHRLHFTLSLDVRLTYTDVP